MNSYADSDLCFRTHKLFLLETFIKTNKQVKKLVESEVSFLLPVFYVFLKDYLVLLPEEYYRPQNLQEEVSKPCELKNGEKYCAYFTYPSVDQDSFVTIEGEDSSVYGGIRRNQKLPDIPFQGLLLSGSRVSGINSHLLHIRLNKDH